MTQEMPAAAKSYMDVVQSRQDNRFIREHFHQVTWLAMLDAQQVAFEFFVLEFRAGNHSALAWMTAAGKWAAGDWLKLAHPDADITCRPTTLTLGYLQGASSYKSLDAATEHLLNTIPEPKGIWHALKSSASRVFRRLGRHAPDANS